MVIASSSLSSGNHTSCMVVQLQQMQCTSLGWRLLRVLSIAAGSCRPLHVHVDAGCLEEPPDAFDVSRFCCSPWVLDASCCGCLLPLLLQFVCPGQLMLRSWF
jgi:hypothetical protein